MGENPRGSFHLLLHVSLSGGIKPATGYWCQLAEQRERLLPACHLLPLLVIKVRIRSCAFLFFVILWVWLFEKYCTWHVCYRLSQQECNEKMRTPTNTSRRSALFPVPTRLVKIKIKIAPISVLCLCCTYLIKRSHLYFSFACLVFPQAICYTTEVSFEEAVLKNLNSFTSVYHVVSAIGDMAKYIF